MLKVRGESSCFSQSEPHCRLQMGKGSQYSLPNSWESCSPRVSAELALGPFSGVLGLWEVIPDNVGGIKYMFACFEPVLGLRPAWKSLWTKDEPELLSLQPPPPHPYPPSHLAYAMLECKSRSSCRWLCKQTISHWAWPWILFLWGRISYSQGWPQTCYVVEDSPNLLILLPPPSKYWVYRCVQLCITWVQGC